MGNNNYYRIIDNGSMAGPKARYTFQMFHFYPEIGPKGTPGRGPYCLAWVNVLSRNKQAMLENIESQGAQVLPADHGRGETVWSRVGR